MSNVRRWLLAGLVLFTGFVIFHGLSSYGWKGHTTPPAGVAAQTLSYTCAAPWRPGYVHGPAAPAYPLSGSPCGQRTQTQLVTGADAALGLAGIGAVLAWRRRSPEPGPDGPGGPTP